MEIHIQFIKNYLAIFTDDCIISIILYITCVLQFLCSIKGYLSIFLAKMQISNC